ncbi:hypothetical protein BKA64DRAFT_683710 [Cadophora sp. MPI-SDFR-AT-0126]|nr:hypothetical protein BKA64DRAFT_683710 [Leotiomycetes sp. MPI-SDFR-AT-0126]
MPLQMFTTVRRKIAASLCLLRRKPRYPYLPPELISRILEYTLLTSDPLYLLIATGTIPKSQKRLTKPHLNDMALAKNFHSLCLVSKSFRTEAMKIFFSRNLWQLEVRLYVPTPKSRHFLLGCGWRGKALYALLWTAVKISQLLGNPPPHEEPMWIVTKVDALTVLGEEALGLMRNVKLVVVRYSHMSVHLDVLDGTMAALKEQGSLERLVVQYIPYYAKDRMTGCVRSVPYDMLQIMERMGLDEEGSRKQHMDSWTYEYWEKMEDVMGSMGKLGPVRDVIICGCVTDEYSSWLEGAIREGVENREQRVFDRALEGSKMRGLL